MQRVLAGVLAAVLAPAASAGQLDTITLQYTDALSGRPLPLSPPRPGPLLLAHDMQATPHRQSEPSVGFGPLPCDCSGEDIGCGCCAGISMAYFNWHRRACFNLTYDPYEFEFGVNLLMDGKSVFKRSVSGKNPPRMCVPIPTPLPVLPTVDFCVHMFNVFTPPPGYNLHACMNFETRLARAPVLVLEFDCLRLGSAGVFLLKPEDYGEVPEPSTPPAPGEEEGGQEGEDEYDEVTEDRRKGNATEVPPVPPRRP
ncbi:NADH dehydrogenase [ubiquinone] 1 alpha subcomplex subunit 4-like 2 [Frankliniella fusca]|uniref:NADH dehydrogenase [ubiquinone] 1 alpha subcomplex subunit 4-like 2 n=1 Tax=Frankliniella fusca TaxID=407009 RepID=A0AAE1HJG6_9NEOP|nr:NADH dehydrogenase [ubiquinone] 1 alpha subcomplex subunit 4-like 2 [Frankliniella fusca]